MIWRNSYRHKADIGFYNFNFRAVYSCTPAFVIGNTEKQQIVTAFVIYGSLKAFVIVWKTVTGIFYKRFTVIEIGLTSVFIGICNGVKCVGFAVL